MTNTIHPDEVPYLNELPRDGRTFVLYPLLQPDGQCLLFLPKDSEILVIRPVGHIEGSFIAQNPIDPDRDLFLPLSDCVSRYFSFPPVLTALDSIEADLRNSLATIHKYFVLLQHARHDKSIRSSVLVATELEYAFSNHRSLYDRLNEVVRV